MRITKSKTIVDGHGITLKNGGTREPVIHIGNTRGNKKIQEIVVRNFVIDGERGKKKSEMSKWGTHIRNNGISIRHVNRVVISNCTIFNCRSGGIVPQHCEDVDIINCEIYGNFFDAIAPWNCKRVRIRGCVLRDNDYAGISVDGGCEHITATRCKFMKNGTYDVWVRGGKYVRASDAKKVCLKNC